MFEIPIVIQQHDTTICRQTSDEVACLDLESENEYFITFEEWDDVKHNFVLVSIPDLKQLTSTIEALCERIDCTKPNKQQIEILNKYINKE